MCNSAGRALCLFVLTLNRRQLPVPTAHSAVGPASASFVCVAGFDIAAIDIYISWAPVHTVGAVPITCHVTAHCRSSQTPAVLCLSPAKYTETNSLVIVTYLKRVCCFIIVRLLLGYRTKLQACAPLAGCQRTYSVLSYCQLCCAVNSNAEFENASGCEGNNGCRDAFDFDWIWFL
jgi:hypothetical protein